MLYRIVIKRSKQIFKDNITKSMLVEFKKENKLHLDDFEIYCSNVKAPKAPVWELCTK